MFENVGKNKPYESQVPESIQFLKQGEQEHDAEWALIVYQKSYRKK